jgi:hypothetical protein
MKLINGYLWGQGVDRFAKSASCFKQGREYADLKSKNR